MSPWKRLRQRIYPYRWKLLAGLAISLANSTLALPVAALLRRAFDHSIPSQQVQELAWIGLALLGLRTISTLAVLLTQHINLAVTRNFTASLRRELLDKIFRLPHAYFISSPYGKVQDILVNSSERVDTMVSALLNNVLPSSVLATTLALVLVYLDYRLFLLMLLVWPATWLLNEFFRRRAVKAACRHNQVFRKFSTQLRWVVGAIDFVRIHNADAQEIQRGSEVIEETQESSKPVNLLHSSYVQIQMLLLTSVSLVILIVGGSQVAAGTMSLGELLSFYTVVSLLNTALRDFAAGLYLVVVGGESMREISELLAEESQLPYLASQEHTLQSKLQFCNVTFAYPNNPQRLLNGVNLELQTGQLLALVGPNGCGKSTLLSLLLGFSRPDHGQLLADDVAYDQIDVGHLRSQLGVVAQEPLLFSGTIADNVRYAHPEASPQELSKALELACAKEWVESLPNGLESPIGDRGTMISGGQRQRLAIARALLGKPRFLILDEPTNHLDSQAIAKIMDNLRQIPEAPGILIITHDESVAAQADCVYRLEQGGLLATRSLGRKGEIAVS